MTESTLFLLHIKIKTKSKSKVPNHTNKIIADKLTTKTIEDRSMRINTTPSEDTNTALVSIHPQIIFIRPLSPRNRYHHHDHYYGT